LSNTTLGVAYHYQDKFEMRGHCDLDVTGHPLLAIFGVTDPTAHYSKADSETETLRKLLVGFG